MGGEDHTFAWLRRRLYLLAENPEKHLLRYPSRTVQPIDFGLVYVGALPGPMGISCEVHADTLARVAGFFPSPAGSFIRNTGFFSPTGRGPPRARQILALRISPPQRSRGIR
jgi:hypothetical protein